MEEISLLLTEIKHKYKLNNKDLAQEFGVTEAQASRYVRGNSMPSLGGLISLAKKYPFSLDALISHDTNINNAEKIRNSIQQAGKVGSITQQTGENQNYKELYEVYKELAENYKKQLDKLNKNLDK